MKEKMENEAILETNNRLNEIKERINQAFNRTLLINQLKREIGRTIFRLGEQLYLVLQDFKNLTEKEVETMYGHSTFNAYLGAPEEAGWGGY